MNAKPSKRETIVTPNIVHSIGPRHTTASVGFWAVCLVQFMTAFVDNAFRIGIIAFAVFIEDRARGDAAALAHVWPAHKVATISTILMLLPYALLSLAAGALADRYPKRWVFIIGKFAELPLMAIGMIGLVWSFGAVTAGESPGFGIGLVLAMIFFLGVQVAFISPARYGILPEILDDESLTEGNGYLELCSFGGIFAGTLAAGFVVDGLREGSAYWWAPWLVPAATLIGIAGSFFIPYTPPANPTRPVIEGFLPQRFMQNWRVLQSRRGLVTAVWGMVVFWSAGVAVTLNAANAGKTLLGLGSSPIDANNLVVAVSIGLGLGSLTAGRLSRGGIELGLVPLGALIWALSFAGLSLTHVLGISLAPDGREIEKLNPTLFLLFLNGFGAGMFVIPINAFVEHESPHEHRASCIATSNIVQVLGMIFMSLVVMVLIDVMPDMVGVKIVWVVLGVLLACVAMWVVRLFPDIFIRFMQSLFVRIFYRFRVIGEDNVPSQGGALIVYNHLSYMDGTLAMSAVHRPTRFVIWAGHYKSRLLKWLGELSGAITVDPHASPKELVASLRKASEALERGEVVAVFAEGGISRTGVMLPFHRGLEVIAKRAPNAPIIPAYIDGMWGSIFSYSGGKFFWGWPSLKRRRVTVMFGEPLPNDTSAPVVRTKVRELGSEAWKKRRKSFRPLGQLFIHSAWKFGKRPCIADLNRELTYGETIKAAVALSCVLHRHAGADKFIGVLAPPSVGASLTNLALSILGRTAVNLNYTIGDDVMNRCIDQCGIRIVFASRTLIDKLGLKPKGKIVYLEDLKEQITKGDKLRAAAAWLLPPWISTRTVLRSSGVPLDDLATIVFSSGSTGDPKGVMLTHFNIAANVQAGIEVIGVLKTDVLMGVLPLFHSFGYNVTMWLPFLVGAKVVYHYSPLEPDVVGGLVKKHGGTLFLSTATFLRGHLRKNEKEDLASLRYIICGAEKLPMQLADQFEKKFGVRPLEGYGCTELSPLVSCNRQDVVDGDTRQVLGKQGTIGHPLPGIAVKVANPDTFEDLPIGSEGVLLVTGPNVMKGYLHKPELTAAAIRDGWYVTGDIAKVDEDGFITITDRVSRFSKIGGEMVPHAKVEDLIHETLSTNDRVCIVVGLPDERKGERLVVVHTKLTMPVDQLWNQLRETLPPLWVPAKAAFMEVPELPVLGSGKLDLKGAKTLAANRNASAASATDG